MSGGEVHIAIAGDQLLVRGGALPAPAPADVHAHAEVHFGERRASG